MKKEVFKEENKTDYSLKQGAIKSADDCGLKNLTVAECCYDSEYDESYCNEENTYRVEKTTDPVTGDTIFKKVVR